MAEESKLDDELTQLKESEDISNIAMCEIMKDVVKLSELEKKRCNLL